MGIAWINSDKTAKTIKQGGFFVDLDYIVPLIFTAELRKQLIDSGHILVEFLPVSYEHVQEDIESADQS